MSRRSQLCNRLFLALGILCILYYLGMGITVRFGQSLLFLWLLAGALCLLRYAIWRRAWRLGRPLPVSRRLLRRWRWAVCLILAVFLTVEGFVVSGAFQQPPAGLDYIVILGARVDSDGPSGALRNRIQTAAQYLQDNPETIAIASGGQGSDEPMSEAQCIQENLVALGIDPARILMEEKSTDTVENLRGSFAQIPEADASVGIVTNDFHIFRAMCIGRKLGDFSLSGVPVPSSAFGFVHYAMREFFALTVDGLLGNLAFS